MISICSFTRLECLIFSDVSTEVTLVVNHENLHTIQHHTIQCFPGSVKYGHLSCSRGPCQLSRTPHLCDHLHALDYESSISSTADGNQLPANSFRTSADGSLAAQAAAEAIIDGAQSTEHQGTKIGRGSFRPVRNVSSAVGQELKCWSGFLTMDLGFAVHQPFGVRHRLTSSNVYARSCWMNV